MDNIIPNHPNNPDQPDDDGYEQRLKDLKQSIEMDQGKILANLADNTELAQFGLDVMTAYFEYKKQCETAENNIFTFGLDVLGDCEKFRESIADTVAAIELRG